MWINGTRKQVARTPVMQYESVNQTTIVFKEGQITEIPINIIDMYAVMYESWTAPIH